MIIDENQLSSDFECNQPKKFKQQNQPPKTRDQKGFGWVLAPIGQQLLLKVSSYVISRHLSVLWDCFIELS